MDNLIITFSAAIKIFILDIVLCGDNIGVIALATRNLPKEHIKKASALGIFLSVILRMFFASVITFIIAIQWLPIKLFGGIILIKITWDFLKSQKEQEDIHVKSSDKFWGAVLSILVADISMSLDNVLAIGAAAKGDTKLIVFGLLFSIPILFLGSQFVSKLMAKYTMAVYVGGSILAHTSTSMILEDRFVSKYITHTAAFIIPIAAAAIVLIYGIYGILKKKQHSKNLKEEMRILSVTGKK